MMDRPAFPGTIAAKPFPAAVRSPAASNAAKNELGTIKVILGFLALATVANLVLTIALNRPKVEVEETASGVKANTALEEIRKLRDELNYTRVNLSNSVNEIGRLKVEYSTVTARLASVTTSGTPVHATETAPASGSPKETAGGNR